MDSARASQSNWWLGTTLVPSASTHRQIDSARAFILPFCKRSAQITLLAQRNERLGASQFEITRHLFCVSFELERMKHAVNEIKQKK